MLNKMVLPLVLSTTLMISSMPTTTSFQQAKGLIVENDEQIKTIELKSNFQLFQEEVTKKTEENKKEKERLEKEQTQKAEIKKQNNTQDYTLTFYGWVECVGGRKAITTHGVKPYEGMVANNVIPQGTIIKLEGYGEVIVADRGGNNFNVSNRLDVYIDSLPGESESHYQKRIDKMGRVTVKGTILK